MSVIDRSWSEPHGAPVVAPAMLATGTAAHTVPGLEEAEPQQFLGLPVTPRLASRASAVALRANHDATSLVDPLPAPWRPGAHDRSAPRAAMIPDERAVHRLQRRSARHRRRIAILVGAVAAVALACGVTALLSRAPARQVAAPQERPPQQPRASMPAVVPPAARAIPAKPRHASTAAPKQVAVAKQVAPAPKPTATPNQIASAAKPIAATPKLTAATPKQKAATPKLTVATPKQLAAKSTTASPKQLTAAAKPTAASRQLASKPTAAFKRLASSPKPTVAPRRTAAASKPTAAAPKLATAAPKGAKAKKPAPAKPRS